MFNSNNVTWRLFSYVKPYRLIMGVAAVLFLISTGLNLVFPLVSGELVNVVTGAVTNVDVPQVIGLLIVVFVVKAIIDIASQFLIAQAGESVTRDLRTQVYDHLQILGLSFYSSRRTGELTSRLTSDVSVVRIALVNNVATFLSSVLTVVGSAVLLITINWRLTGIVMLVLPIAVGVARLYSRSLRPLSTQVQDRNADASAVAEEAISGVRVVKAFGREPYESQRFGNAAQAAYTTSLKLARIRATFGPLIGLMFFFSLVSILWFGSQEVSAGRLRAGDLVSFLLYGGIIGGGVSSLASIFSQFQEAVGATKRLFEILDTEADVKDAPNARDAGRVHGRITFDGVSFSYENDVEVVSDISIDIAPGEILALVGPSGAGKSTLFNLIPRFYDPSKGAVTLDGTDLRELTVASLRSNIAIVPQDTQLFGGNIRDNIAYGRLDAGDDEIIAAARAANAHDFIMQLPDGYATVVGERGTKLSGGQRQRVAIARAILKDPRILLLDEATSALDSESEGLVQEALGRLMQSRTTIIIAHRLSTVQVAHRIAVLEKGRLVELGTHDELMAKGGLYYRLYSLQFSEVDLLGAAEQPAIETNGAATVKPRRRGFSLFPPAG